ncbi:MutS-related protein [Macrococcus carouselicus]|uniref:DNA mismatch repair proteins mutS family domain-containing protein n=1 Tax=Macrococcus carouselicus TaxID=69969 RepID=A0A9Q8FPZ2_9STAP|nr:hypothetical protein [Macrococcus carouselicus]TDM02464.1 hypothetical protein ERX40_07875 [Macrococcus carouselicus]
MARGLTMLLNYLWITLGFLILGIGLMIYDKRKQNTRIKGLWDRKTAFKIQQGDYIRYDGYYLNCRLEDEGIDEITWNDLNMMTVFRQLNYNFTTVGEEYLYAALRNVGTLPKVNRDLMERIRTDRVFRENLSMALADLGKNANSNPSQFIDKTFYKERYNKLYILFSLLPLMSLLLFNISVTVGLVALFMSIGFNMMQSFTFTSKNETNYSELFYAVQLIRSADQLSKISPHYPVKQGRLRSVGLLSYLMLHDKQNDQNFFLQILNALKSVFNADYHLYYYAVSILNRHHETYEACFHTIGLHDLSYATALWRETLVYYTEPEAGETLVVKDGYHPLLRDFVANDLELSRNVILTGSNASGKSTFMKMLALNIVLSKGLQTAAAERFILPAGDLYTSMNLEDSIMAGDSYFISEIKSLKRILQQADRPVYIFIDEILRGTNTKERVASAEAILRYLNSQPDVTLITATHDIELTAMLENEFDFYYFSETLTEDNDVTFDYKLKRGITKTSNAIELMRIYDYPERIYQGARETVRQTT